MKIAVVGVGSLGTILGALLSRDGLEPLLVDVNREQVNALNRNGATITGHLSLNVPVRAITPDALEGAFDLFIYTTKSTYDDVALPELLPFFAPTGCLITLQNGVPEERVASFVGRERTLGGAVGWGATWQGPGVSELTSEPEKMTYDIGEMDGANTERIERIKQVLDRAGTAAITGNLIGVRWSKLLVNITFSGMSTVIGGSYGEVLDDETAIRLAAAITVECIDTAAALGIKFEPIQGLDPSVLKPLILEQEENALNVIRMVYGPHRDIRASMLQDCEKGLRCEVETLNGYLSYQSKKVGVATPVNDKVVEMIREMEAGARKPGKANLDLFPTPA